MTEWINSDGSFGDIANAPEVVRDLATKKGYKGVEDLAMAYSNAEKKFGVEPERLVTWPKDESDVDGYKAIYSRFGVPETPDGYKFEYKAPEGIEVDDNILGDFKAKAHQLKLNNAQVNALVQYQLDLAKQGSDNYSKQLKEQAELQAKQSEEAQAKAIEALKKEHGIKTEAEYVDFMNKAQKMAEDAGLFQVLDETGLKDDPRVIKALHEMSKKVSDQALPNKNNTQGATDNKARIAEITKDPAFTSPTHPQHQAIMKEYLALHGVS